MAESKQQQQLKEITERLEKGVQELFTSEKYMEYLRVMSQFHNYSFSNTLLIAMQKPDATLVAGYGAWKKKFERNVMKGEKAIKIFAPAPRKVEIERDVIDPDTKRPVLDENGEPKKETVTIQKPYFKVTSVFDVSQTDGKPLPELATVQDLTGSVEGYAMFFEALRRTSKVPMDFEVIEGDSHGYYHQVEKRIAIAEGMSEAQNVKTAIHEIAHSRLHDVDMADAENGVMVDRRTREVQAESVAYTVCQRYGIETSEYSFGYIAGWSNGREMKELRSSMEVIRREADSMIKEIDANIEAIRKERALQSEQEQPFIKQFYVVEDLQVKGPLSIQRFEDMDTALKAYFALPNEKMKAFGIENSNPLPGSLDFIQCINGIDRIVVDYLGVEGWKNPEIIAATDRIDVALDLHDAQIAYRIGEQYFSIQHTEEGFDYTDTLILTYCYGLKVVSVYSLYTLLFGIIATSISNFNGANFILGQSYNTDKQRFVQLLDVYEIFNMILTFSLFCVANIFILPFIRLYTSGVSDTTYIDRLLPYLFIAIYLLSNGRNSSSQVINYAGHFKQTQSRSILESVINIVVSLACVFRFGIYGVLLGTIAALLYRTNDMIIYANKKILHRSPWKTYRRWLVNLALFIAVTVLSKPLFARIALDTYPRIILWAAITSVVVIPLFFVVASMFDRETYRYAKTLVVPYLK